MFRLWFERLITKLNVHSFLYVMFISSFLVVLSKYPSLHLARIGTLHHIFCMLAPFCLWQCPPYYRTCLRQCSTIIVTSLICSLRILFAHLTVTSLAKIDLFTVCQLTILSISTFITVLNISRCLVFISASLCATGQHVIYIFGCTWRYVAFLLVVAFLWSIDSPVRMSFSSIEPLLG